MPTHTIPATGVRIRRAADLDHAAHTPAPSHRRPR